MSKTTQTTGTSRRQVIKAMTLGTAGAAVGTTGLALADDKTRPDPKKTGEVSRSAVGPNLAYNFGTSYRFYCGSDFKPRSSTYTYNVTNNSGIYITSTGGGTVRIGLDLPHLATVTELAVFVLDNDDTVGTDITASFYRNNPLNGFTTIGSATTTGAVATTQQLNITTGLPVVIDNINYTYDVWVILPVANTMNVTGLRVGYKTSAGELHYLATPTTIIDTRPGSVVGGITGPFSIEKSWYIAGSNGIPANATGIIGTVTVFGASPYVNPLPNSFLLLYPYLSSGGAAVMVYGPSTYALSNGYVCQLNSGSLSIRDGGGQPINALVVVTGYFV